MIAKSATDGEYTDAEHYATMMAEDNDHITVDYIHGGDEDCAPFFVLVVEDGSIGGDLVDWARIKGWEVADIRNRESGNTAVRFAEQ